LTQSIRCFAYFGRISRIDLPSFGECGCNAGNDFGRGDGLR
jgi:hypothetical protein